MADQKEIVEQANEAIEAQTSTPEELEKHLAISQDSDGNFVLIDSRTGELVDEAVTAKVLRDPLAGTNTQQIKAHPPGKRLYWCNERYREASMGGSRGWRGFVKVTFQDEIGKNLGKFIKDPPRRYEGSDQRDNFVRRGDTILCWLPVGIWLNRQKARVQKANRGITEAQAQQKLADTRGRLEGEGLHQAPRPRRGFVMPRESEAPMVGDGEHVRTRMPLIRDPENI